MAKICRIMYLKISILSNTKFINCTFTSTNFSYSNLNNADLSNMNLTDIKINRAHMVGTNFSNSNLEDLDFSFCTINKKTIFTNSNRNLVRWGEWGGVLHIIPES